MVRVSTEQLSTPQIDLTARDFATIKQSLLDFIDARFPDLTSEIGDQSYLGLLLDLFAYEGDILSFYIDQTANENFLVTARQRANIVKLAKLVGYTPRAASPATVTITATIVPSLSSPIVIPAGTRIQVDDLFFEVIAEVVIPVNQTSFAFSMTEGRTITENFTSDGSIFQKFRLTQSPVIVPAIVVTVDNVTWTKVTAIPFSLSEASSIETYAVEQDGDDRAFILFGDDVFSSIPARDSVVGVSYRIGGGVVGNLAISAIKTSIPGFINGVTPTNVQIENLAAGTGGVDRETVDSIKLNAPISVRSNDRLVTQLDYENIPLIFTSDIGAVIRTRVEVLQSTGRQNLVNVYAWTRGTDGQTTPAGVGLITDLDAFITTRKMVTVQHQTQAGTLRSINISATISVLPGFAEAVVVADVEQAYRDLFASDEFQKLDVIRRFDLYGILCSTAGIKFADLIFPASDVVLTAIEAASIGALDIATVS